MIKAIFIDVDGTLLSHTQHAVPKSSECAIKRCRSKGIQVFMSTGRNPYELKKLPLNHLDFDGYVLVNGQLCLNEKKQPVFKQPFEEDAMKQFVSWFEAKQFPLAFVEADRIYINLLNDLVVKAERMISSDPPPLGSYAGGEVYQAITYFPLGKETAFDVPKGYKMTRWNDYGVDIIAENAGKVIGIEAFCKLNHWRREELMAIGDAQNDLDMLRYVGVSVAMGNAKEEVKAACDYVTDDIDANGLAKAIEYYEKQGCFD